MSTEIAERVRRVIQQQDPGAAVVWVDGALQVESVMPAATLVALLRAHHIDTQQSERSDCCGGCCRESPHAP